MYVMMNEILEKVKNSKRSKTLRLSNLRFLTVHSTTLYHLPTKCFESSKHAQVIQLHIVFIFYIPSKSLTGLLNFTVDT